MLLIRVPRKIERKKSYMWQLLDIWRYQLYLSHRILEAKHSKSPEGFHVTFSLASIYLLFSIFLTKTLRPGHTISNLTDQHVWNTMAPFNCVSFHASSGSFVCPQSLSSPSIAIVTLNSWATGLYDSFHGSCSQNCSTLHLCKMF